MLILLSPAKSLDYETPPAINEATEPALLADATVLIEQLRRKKPAQIAQLMSLSDALTQLNVRRYADWTPRVDGDNSKQAILAFNGDVYDGLQASSLRPAQFKWAQKHLRILSGLYGVLKPLDLIQPYRLEMGTKLKNPRGADLYAYWREPVAEQLSAALGALKPAARVIVNCASNEYFKAVDVKALSVPVITPVFEERHGAAYRVVSFFAKRARGMFARYAIEHKAAEPSALHAFDADGYAFDAAASSETTWRFRRG